MTINSQISFLIWTEKLIAFRLQGQESANGTGRLEVFYKRQWGTICDDNWDMKDARVACRQLGYKYAVTPLKGLQVRDGSRKIWLDDVNCTGSELNLTTCSHNGWGKHNCGKNQYAGVECSLTGKSTFELVYKYLKKYLIHCREYNL